MIILRLILELINLKIIGLGAASFFKHLSANDDFGFHLSEHISFSFG